MRNTRSTFRFPVLAAALAASLLTATPAVADNAAAAQVLYDRAVELMGQKNYKEACPKLEEVTRLVPEGLGAKLTLAECYEADGRLASAWLQYSLVASAAARAGQGDRERLATERAAALKPKLAKLTIKVPAAVKSMPELLIKRGGVDVGPAQFNEQIPVDAGVHLIEATAHGKKPWSLEAEIPADGAKLTVEVPVLEDDPKARLSDPPPSPGPSAGSSSEPTWLFPAGLVVGGVGVVGLGVGAVLGAVAMGTNSDAEAACPGGRCTREGNDLLGQAGSMADVSTVMFIAGGALAAGGLVMVLVAPSGDEARPADEQAGLSLELAPLPGGLSLSGSF